MIVVPAAIPVAIPVPGPIVATNGLPLPQVPPGVASANVVVKPTHTDSVPVMAAGNGFTVTMAVLIQPVGKVYVIVVVAGNVDPVIIPVTSPVALIEPIPGRLLLHVPPGIASVNWVVCPWHTLSVPFIGVGNVLIVTIVVV